jgi:hypothetical protein
MASHDTDIDSVGRREGLSFAGMWLALRRVRDPLLLAGLIGFVVMGNATGAGAVIDMGFDFRGTLWEPAQAVLHGGAIYAEPTRAGVEIGNPSVYPPLFILLTTPLALLSFGAAVWIWWAILVVAVPVTLRIVGVRDWRCYAVALLSPVVGQGLFFGNLTLLLMVPIGLAWRYRDRPWIAGAAVGVAVAAKLFAWPLVLWLLLTRRFKAGLTATLVGCVLLLVPWALIGFEGLRDYPTLLHALDGVYGRVSLSLATVAAALGASPSVATALATLAGIALVGLAWWLGGRADGDRRSFAAVIGACILASPIVWQNYTALLFIPIAITWSRMAPAWFFGYAIWLMALLPKPTVPAHIPCCKPPDLPQVLWEHSHADPAWGHAGGTVAVVVAVTALLVATRSAPDQRRLDAALR